MPIVKNPNGQKTANPYDKDEFGILGLEGIYGVIQSAYTSELYYPHVMPIYNRIRRADPEVGIVRAVYSALAGQVDIKFRAEGENEDDDPLPVELEAADFGNQVLEDLEGGITDWLKTCVSYAPFLGWSYWEIVPGVRNPQWKPPGRDTWESQFDDNLIGVRRLGFRDHNTFERWELDEKQRVRGMWQLPFDASEIFIPIEKAVHIVSGDLNNPEGLPALEAIYRLERIKYGLEVVQGIGFERSAGFLNITTDRDLDDGDKSEIRIAARNLMTAQQGNFGAFPQGVTAEIIDAAFGSAPAIIEAIRYYSILKLQVFVAHAIAIATTAGTGAFSAMSDASETMLLVYNAIVQSYVGQLNRQLGRWLFKHPINAARFAGMRKRPQLYASEIEKQIALDVLATFMKEFVALFDVSESDVVAIRRKSGFMEERLPIDDEIVEPRVVATPPPFGAPDGEDDDETDDEADDDKPADGVADDDDMPDDDEAESDDDLMVFTDFQAIAEKIEDMPVDARKAIAATLAEFRTLRQNAMNARVAGLRERKAEFDEAREQDDEQGVDDEL